MHCAAAEKQAIWRCGKQWVYFDFMCRNCGTDQLMSSWWRLRCFLTIYQTKQRKKNGHLHYKACYKTLEVKTQKKRKDNLKLKMDKCHYHKTFWDASHRLRLNKHKPYSHPTHDLNNSTAMVLFHFFFSYSPPNLQAQTPILTTTQYTKQNGDEKPMNIHCHNQLQIHKKGLEGPQHHRRDIFNKTI